MKPDCAPWIFILGSISWPLLAVGYFCGFAGMARQGQANKTAVDISESIQNENEFY